jgi:hypothetical protein
LQNKTSKFRTKQTKARKLKPEGKERWKHIQSRYKERNEKKSTKLSKLL